ncbi:DDE-type integrase/transposase/recombinase [Acidovorax sp. A1169]|uniref:DDE-type integrase/transposase/recombinase n=1 Tax=Acidovorax sp. A1169 TaxID=3059524 RepID=UPI002737F90D|nr:DDE-type integrase/transposase/recombinase [Acidovorax sp. A1169]MDP4078524.1 DDE-type integrase/transposase/recombinase [Acidovorax sp. A1169]
MAANVEANSLEAQSFPISRRRIEVRSGALVKHSEGVFRIDEVLDFDTVTATSVETGRARVLRIGELDDMDQAPQPLSDVDIDAITEDDWRIAQSRYAAIKPLIDAGMQSRAAVEARATELGISPATVYRWLTRYRSLDAVSGLIPLQRGWRKGNGRLSSSAEKLIKDVIEDFHLTKERPTAQKTVREVQRLSQEQGIAEPSASAIRARIESIPDYQRMLRRGQREQAKNKYLPVPGQTPGGSYPLEHIQIDHTPIDVIVVDDVHRLPIDRPWLTVAIDEYSRMTVGYYLSFDAPSMTSVGMCLSHSILPKDEWLMLHGIEAPWPVWGRPKVVRCDNGPDFRSNSFRKSCAQHGIDVEFRPVKVPRYGGYIERLQGTFLRELHDLPGSTFSSVKHRGEYDSEGRAVMTKSELEKQLLMLICNEYHRRKHSALGMPPLRKWELGVFGGAGVRGRGMAARPADRMTVFLDFLPIIERTVQADGVTIDNVRYYADVLRLWIGAVDPQTNKARMHIFRRDPRDISCLWFYDPDVKQYSKIPTADLDVPPSSIWEFRKGQEEVRRSGFDPSDAKEVFKSIGVRRAMVADSALKTKRARREAQRTSEHQKATNPARPLESQSRPAKDAPPRAPLAKLTAPPGLARSVAARDDIA